MKTEIKVQFPNGHERLKKGKQYIVRWDGAFTSNVQVHVYRGFGLHAVLGANEPNDGELNLFVPDWPVGSDYRIGISSAGSGLHADFSDCYFSIED